MHVTKAPVAWLLLLTLMGCGARTGENPGAAEMKPPLARPQAEAESASACAVGALPTKPRQEDFLSFPNFGHRGVGRCRAHALLTQQMLLLANFRPELPAAVDCETQRAACRSHVWELLRRMGKGETVEIAGWANLAEFSAQPTVRFVLRAWIISHPVRYFANRVPLPGPRRLAVFQEARRRLGLGHVPYLALLGPLVGDHGVLAYAAETREGRDVLCVRDPNIVPEGGKEECLSYLLVDGEDVRYVRDGRPEDVLAQLDIFNDEDERVELYRRALCPSEHGVVL